ncbi:hypothetical protein D3C71_1370090 [compost metagenome]
MPQRIDRLGGHGHKLFVAAQAGHEELAQAAFDQLAVAGAQVGVGFAQLALQKAGQGGLADIALADRVGPLNHQGGDDDCGQKIQNPGPPQAPGAREDPDDGGHPHGNRQQQDLASPPQQNVFNALHRPSFFVVVWRFHGCLVTD